jgi:hypothetical protein
MGADLGIRKPRRRSLTEKAVWAVFAMVALGFPLSVVVRDYLDGRDVALNLAREWTIEGPACPSLTRAQFEARGLKVRRGTVYEDAEFYREFGHMSCSGLRDGAGWGTALYPVCQFTSPRALKVVTRKGEWYFDPGPGQPATVAAPHGQVRCVLAANFTMEKLLRR